MGVSEVRRNPDDLTAHFAGGGRIDAGQATWLAQNLAELRASEPGSSGGDHGASLARLRRVYMGARIIQGGVVASRLALPALVEAGRRLRDASLPDDLRSSEAARAQTERFLTGMEDGRPRQGNDYPDVVKKYISALATTLEGPYGRAYRNLERERPDLLALGCDADELQRLAWAHMRWLIDEVVPADEVAHYRKKPLREGTDDLLRVLTERIGLRLPARVMQRDDWRTALESARQDPHVALFDAMKFFVENAEIGVLYCLGSLLTRIALCRSAEDALRGHLRHGPREIAAGTQRVTHAARFQSRVGARPNDYRSFREFLRNVRRRTAGASLRNDGTIAWPEWDARRERGWCPAQNAYEAGGGGTVDLAREGRAAVDAWRAYGRTRFGIEPLLSTPAPSELFGCLVVFATMHEHSPLRPESEPMRELAAAVEG